MIVQRNSSHTLPTFLTEYLQQDKQLQILSRHAPCLSHQRAAVHHQGWKPDRWLLHCGPSEDHEDHCRFLQPFRSTATDRWSGTLSQHIGDSSSFNNRFRCSSGGLSENLRRIFPKHNILFHFSPGNTLRLLHPKDKTLKHHPSNVVHAVQSLSLFGGTKQPSIVPRPAPQVRIQLCTYFCRRTASRTQTYSFRTGRTVGFSTVEAFHMRGEKSSTYQNLSCGLQQILPVVQSWGIVLCYHVPKTSSMSTSQTWSCGQVCGVLLHCQNDAGLSSKESNHLQSSKQPLFSFLPLPHPHTFVTSWRHQHLLVRLLWIQSHPLQA